MSELARIQGRFAAGLLTPAPAPNPTGNPGQNPIDLFRGDPDLAARRFALYRGNLTANWDRALGNAYPVLRRLVGAAFFRGLAREFGRARPLAEGDLNRFGDGLADFLAGFAPVAAYPYMPDVARLEWALHCAHYGADEPVLTLADLAAIDAGSLATLTPRFPDVCRLLQSPWDTVAIWEAHQDPDARLPADVARRSLCVVCRPRWRAEPLRLSAGEYEALAAIRSGAPLGDALAAGAEADPRFDPGTALPRWLTAGIFAAQPDSRDDNEDKQ